LGFAYKEVYVSWVASGEGEEGRTLRRDSTTFAVKDVREVLE